MPKRFRAIRELIGFNGMKALKRINIELCTKCNLRCRYCSLDKPRAFLDLDVFEKFIRQLVDEEVKLDWLTLSHSAEFFLHPQWRLFVDSIGFVKDWLNTKVSMSTNLMLLDKQAADFIIDSRVFDKVICSIDGYNKKDFEYLRAGAEFDIVYNNYKYFASNYNGYLLVNHGTIPSSSDMIDARYLEMFSMASQVVHYNFHDWIGDIESPAGHTKDAKSGLCQYILDHMVLFANGDIGICCSDLNGRTVYGNVTEKSVRKIWKSFSRKKAILMMLLGKRQRIGACKECSLL